MIAEDYVRMVAFELRDLPWRMRRELVSELEGHLGELPAGTNLHERLGGPNEYAAEMRAAAGLERRRGLIAFLRARRPRNLILTAVVLTVAGLVIGAVVWVQSYQPIAFAGGSIDPAGAKGRVGLYGESVVFHEGRPFQFGTTVENRGRFAVRVLGVPEPAGLPFSARLMISGPLKNGGVHGPYTRFRPFDLEPGQVRLLFFRGVLACRVNGANVGIGLTDFPVRFSFLWRTATVYIPLDEQLAIVFPSGFRCP